MPPTSGGAPTSYQYRQSDDDGANWGEWTDVPGSDGDTDSYTVFDLTNDTAYTFPVRGNNSGGFGLESDSATATPVVPDPPGAPQNLQTLAGHQNVKLSWDPPSAGDARKATNIGGAKMKERIGPNGRTFPTATIAPPSTPSKT